MSFVVLCYNHEQFIRDCLDSILGQEGEYNFEVIFVDDASPDRSRAVAHAYTDPRIHFIFHERNLGHIATVYDGLTAARGQYVARIDADDRYRNHFLKTVLPIFAQHPEVGLVYGDAALINVVGQITQDRSDTVHYGKDFKGNEFVALLKKNFICAPTVIARRESWLQSLPIPAGLAFHDWYFTLMMARKYEFYYVNHPLADYRVHGGNMHSRNTLEKLEEPAIFRLLDMLFNETEREATLENEKRRARSSVYAAHYVDMAEKYFGCNYNGDARRCYWQALKHRPGYLLNATILRHFLGVVVGRTIYDSLKAFARPAHR